MQYKSNKYTQMHSPAPEKNKGIQAKLRSCSETRRQHQSHNISHNARPAGIVLQFWCHRSGKKQDTRQNRTQDKTGLCQTATFIPSIMKAHKKCDNLHFMYFCTSRALRYAEIRSSRRKRRRPAEIKGIASPSLCLEL